MRAIAVLMVVAFHAGLPIPGGYVGVDVFFVISGFVITSMLQREWADNARIRFGRFYLRRFKRLTPALAVTVAVVTLGSSLILSPLGTQQIAARTGIGAMLLSANQAIASTTGGYFDLPADYNPLLNTWSLSVEEQFYLAFPAMLAIGWTLARRRTRSILNAPMLVAAVAILSFGAAVLGSTGYRLPAGTTSAAAINFLLGFYSPLTRAWEFAAGALLALGISYCRLRSRRHATTSALLGVAGLAASVFLITDTTPFPGPWTLLPVASTILLIVAGTSTVGNPVSSVLSHHSMVTVGDWSYSIYLWHWPFVVFASTVWPEVALAPAVAAMVSLIPAVASYRWVEQPLRNAPSLGGRQLARLIATSLALPILSAVAVWLIASIVWAPMTGTSVDEAANLPPGYSEGCHFSGPAAVEPTPCEWDTTRPGLPVFLVGDSNAAQYTTGLIQATASADSPLYVSTASSCPLTSLPLTFADSLRRGETCTKYSEATMAWLAQQDPGVVLISASDSYWMDDDVSVTLPDGSKSADTAIKVAMYEQALSATVQSIKRMGHAVVLFQTLPHWTAPYEWSLASCTLLQTLQGCVETMPLDFSLERSAAVRDAVEEVALANDSAIADLAPIVCPDSQCVTFRQGSWVYRDSVHISNDESLSLSDHLGEIIGLPRG